MTTIMNGNSCTPEENNQANQGVGDSVPRRDQGAENVRRDVSPVERYGDQGNAGHAAKELVDDHIIGFDPCYESKHLEELSDPTGEPVPHKRTKEDEEEISITRDSPSI